MSRRLIVVGSGAAGMSAASAARRVDPGLDVVVLEASGYAAYGMCGLPYYIAGLVPEAEDLLAYPPAFFRDKRGIDLRLSVRAVAVDPGGRTVAYEDEIGASGELAYDRLVVAAGGTPVVPSLPGVGHPRVLTVRTLDDAITIRRLLDDGLVRRALVVGGGYIGLEMAEALAGRNVDVSLVEMLPRLMPTIDEPMAAMVEDETRAHKVDLHLGSGLKEVQETTSGLEAVLDDATTIEVDLVVVAVGVRAASSVAAAAGAATGPGGGLLVDEQMRTSLPDVFAAGDCIAPHHIVLGRPAFVPLGPAANKTGRMAGTVAAGGTARFKGVVGTAVVKVFDLAVARTGLTLAEAQAEGLDALATDITGKSRAKYYPGTAPVAVRLVHERGGRLLGGQMVGRDGVAKRIDVLATALHCGLDIEGLGDLDLSYAPPFAPVYEPVLLAAQAAARQQA